MVNLLRRRPRLRHLPTTVVSSPIGVSARRGEALSLLPCGKRPTHRLLRGRLLALHREKSSWKSSSGDVAGHPALNAHLSRMIRDISATDILVGNKKDQPAPSGEAAVDATDEEVARFAPAKISVEGARRGRPFALQTIAYQTATTEERFLEWITPRTDRRLLPPVTADGTSPRHRQRESSPPIKERKEAGRVPRLLYPSAPQGAMIREVHVCRESGRPAHTGEGTQHLGLGRALVEEGLPVSNGGRIYAINVISAVGTRVSTTQPRLQGRRALSEAAAAASIADEHAFPHLEQRPRTGASQPAPTPPDHPQLNASRATSLRRRGPPRSRPRDKPPWHGWEKAWELIITTMPCKARFPSHAARVPR